MLKNTYQNIFIIYSKIISNKMKISLIASNSPKYECICQSLCSNGKSKIVDKLYLHKTDSRKCFKNVAIYGQRNKLKVAFTPLSPAFFCSAAV